jgi:hypothetical protein
MFVSGFTQLLWAHPSLYTEIIHTYFHPNFFGPTSITSLPSDANFFVQLLEVKSEFPANITCESNIKLWIKEIVTT